MHRITQSLLEGMIDNEPAALCKLNFIRRDAQSIFKSREHTSINSVNDHSRARPQYPNTVYCWLIGIGIFAGIGFRFLPGLLAGFPVNDGGFFAAMAYDLIQSGFELPRYTSYNQLSIPFAYPPLGLYLLASIQALSGISMEGLLRWLPPLISSASIPAVLMLAGRLSSNRLSAVSSVLFFSLYPTHFAWMNYGAGLTRSLGFLFAILTLSAFTRLYQRNQTIDWLAAGGFFGLTVLSHLEWAYYVAFSTVILFLFIPSFRKLSFLQSIAAVLVAFLVSSAWWLAVIQQHGLAPFQSAFLAGGAAAFSFPVRVYFTAAGEPFFPIIALLSILGLTYSLIKKRWLLPVWFLVNPFFSDRTTFFMLSVPAVLLAGEFVHKLADHLNPPKNIKPIHAWLAAPERNQMIVPVLSILTFASLLINGLSYTIQYRPVTAPTVTSCDLEAMEWIKHHTLPTDRVMVLPVRSWFQDAEGEWFPWLAQRASISTVQGTEWLSGGEFDRRVAHHSELLACQDQSVACVTGWSEQFGVDFEYIFVPESFSGRLRTELMGDQGFHIAHSKGRALVLRVTGPQPDDTQ